LTDDSPSAGSIPAVPPFFNLAHREADVGTAQCAKEAMLVRSGGMPLAGVFKP
jgi:hypothetical protein